MITPGLEGIHLPVNLEAARLKVITIHHLVWDFERLGVLVNLLCMLYQKHYLLFQFLHQWQVLVDLITPGNI